MSLEWPSGFPRTDPDDRERYPGNFQVTMAEAIENVLSEMETWGAEGVDLRTDMEHQKSDPNRPYSSQKLPADPGVAVSFILDGEEMAAACDEWSSVRDNAQDLYHFLKETRMQEKRGSVTAQSEYDKLRLPSGEDSMEPWKVLGVPEDASRERVREAFTDQVSHCHPDGGGSVEEFNELVEAKEAMLDG